MVGENWRYGNEYKPICVEISALFADGRRVEGGNREGCFRDWFDKRGLRMISDKIRITK